MTAASDLANTLNTALLSGTDFSIPLPDFSGNSYKAPTVDPTSPVYAAITKLTNADLTSGTGSLTGTGVFDLLMMGFKAHLKDEFNNNRISGAEYTKAYIASTEAAMANAVQFLVQRDATYWQAVNSQFAAQKAAVDVVTARVGLETAKTQLQYLRIQALSESEQYAINKLRLATESVGYDAAKYNLDTILPKQGLLLDKQAAQADAQTLYVGKQSNQLDKEILLYTAKQTLLQEQVEAARAQTLDTRSDGTVIAGSIGKQKDLYTQQISSYKRDAENKTVKLFTDAWVTMKTIDEGLAPPTQFSNANLDTILASVRTNNNL